MNRIQSIEHLETAIAASAILVPFQQCQAIVYMFAVYPNPTHVVLYSIDTNCKWRWELMWEKSDKKTNMFLIGTIL